MKHRKLRIAWSVAWGVVGVLVCALWIRSYGVFDSISLVRPSEIFAVHSAGGIVVVGKHLFPFHDSFNEGWSINGPIDPYIDTLETVAGFGLRNDGSVTAIVVPHWFLALLTAGVAAVPLRFDSLKFSLRTLLIATTLVAVGLGLAVWLA